MPATIRPSKVSGWRLADFERGHTFIRFDEAPVKRVFNEHANCFPRPLYMTRPTTPGRYNSATSWKPSGACPGLQKSPVLSSSFSSLIGNAVLGGSLLGDTFGFSNNLNNKTVKLFISLVMIFGSVIAYVFGNLPLELIVFAQSITIFLVPFIGIILFLVANDPVIMKEQKNKPFTKVWAITGLAVLLILAASNFIKLIK